MANKFLFEVDASKILAKLHLAGLMPISVNLTDNEFIVNSGIINYVDGATPDKPKDVLFDLSNPVKEYQVGFFTTLHYSGRPVNKQKLEELIDKRKAIISHKDSASSRLSETNSDSSSDSDVNDKDLKELNNNLENVDKYVELCRQEYSTALDNLKKNAVENLRKYMTVFAGSEQGKKITEDTVIPVYVSDLSLKPTDKGLVDSFEIAHITDNQKAEHNKKNEAEWLGVLLKSKYNFDRAIKANKGKLTDRICFVTGFTLLIDR